jgi:L-alanine-DL-glutamate epimerase-like enolase superfamily enzyme
LGWFSFNDRFEGANITLTTLIILPKIMINLSYKSYQLTLKHPFTIAKFTRTHTPIMLIRLNYDGVFGYGEASMVPYMGENEKTALDFLAKIDWSRIKYPFNFEEIIAYLDDIEKGNPAIKAAIDIALNDIQGKITKRSCASIYGAEQINMPVTSYTIGIDTPAVIKEKVADAKGFKVLKVKLGSQNDKEIIETIRSVSSLPLYVDANQGWNDKKTAIEMIYWLHEQGVVFVEQPMDKNNLDGNAWLTQRSPIPILADEAVQRLADIDTIKGAYHGVNVKLMKSCGMHEAYQMILKAKKLGMKVLIGCMSETSCASLAGAALAPLCNWADLDGPWLTSNNPFKTPEMVDGKYQLPNLPGLGLEGADNFLNKSC